MLPLTDALWQKLDAASDRDIPKLLSQLAATWDNDRAHALLWDDLWQQDICYGATFAAVPHLMRLAQADGSREQRLEVALFVGYIAALYAAEPNQALCVLPQTLEGWDRKRDYYRSFVADFESPERLASQGKRPEVPVYKRILALHPVNAADLKKINSIRDEFFAALPAMGALCERALLELVEADPVVEACLLSGIAATDGRSSLAWLLHSGGVFEGGYLRCAACNAIYEFQLYGERIAIYTDRDSESQADINERKILDWEEKSPSRADGVIIPVRHGDDSDVRSMHLLALADRAPSREIGNLLRNFFGHIECCKCGARAAMVNV